jgi:hypothetical protein
MVKRKFSDYKCTVYDEVATYIKWSVVQVKQIVYENIDCAVWEKRAISTPNSLEVQAEKNQYEINFDSSRTLLKIGQTIKVDGMGTYRIISQPVKHTRSNGIVDNIHVITQKTVNDTN